MTRIRNLCISVLLCATVSPSLAQALPPDRTHYVAIHQNPANPSSRVQYYLSIAIHAEEQAAACLSFWAATSSCGLKA